MTDRHPVGDFAEFKQAYRDYKVCDERYEKLGKVEELLVDSADHPLYIGIRKSVLKPEVTLIPMEIVRLNDKRRLVEVARPKYDIEHVPTLAEGEDLTQEFEDGTLSYFGLPSRWNTHGSSSHPTPGPGSLDSPLEEERVDLEPGGEKHLGLHRSSIGSGLTG